MAAIDRTYQRRRRGHDPRGQLLWQALRPRGRQVWGGDRLRRRRWLQPQGHPELSRSSRRAYPGRRTLLAVSGRVHTSRLLPPVCSPTGPSKPEFFGQTWQARRCTKVISKEVAATDPRLVAGGEHLGGCSSLLDRPGDGTDREARRLPGWQYRRGTDAQMAIWASFQVVERALVAVLVVCR